MNILITGGAGFIGINLTQHLLSNNNVTIFDNFSRSGSKENLFKFKIF
jgi:nucleoside-diphosphate-sugar epimerase